MSAELADAPLAFVGQSPKIGAILTLIQKLKRSSSPVLILGETGTGKEVAARSLHGGLERTFVPVDCSALVGPLMESELFGHARGAFTGAANTKVGLLEMAHGGTAFLDEIGELPLDMQVKLLRVLQEKELRPVGSLARKQVDFRVIAATNRDLAGEVERGTFRRDLYYRLNVVTLRIPPLRDRKEDIPLLANHFLTRYGKGHQLTPDLLQSLQSYNWPGNVRELENCIVRMVAMNSGPYLHAADFPSALQNHLIAQTAAGQQFMVARQAVGGGPMLTPAPNQTAEAILPPLSLREQEKRAIAQALRYTRGDRLAAAHLLGISRTTLYRKIREYGIAA